MICRRLALFIVSFFLLLGVLGAPAPWAAYPDHEMKIVIALGAGGGVDRMARSVQRFLPDILKVSVLAENVPGAGGKIGINRFLKLPPDGYSLFANMQPSMTLLRKKDPKVFRFDDFAFINVNWIDPALIMANKNTGWKSLDDMIAAAKKDPGKYSFSIPGFNTTGHIMALLLFQRLGLDIKMVPYDSGGSARAALRGGHVDLTAGGAEGMFVLEDVAVPLGICWEKPIPTWPNVQPINEALAKYNVKMPNAASVRFFATHGMFRKKHPEEWKILVGAFEKLVNEDKAFQAFCDKGKIGRDWYGPEKSLELIMQSDEVFSKIKIPGK
jgi:putative tricarboxylic transport membrane protein